MNDPADMKTTIEVPDDLYRRVKSEAALRGLKVRDLVEKGLARISHSVVDICRAREQAHDLCVMDERILGADCADRVGLFRVSCGP